MPFSSPLSVWQGEKHVEDCEIATYGTGANRAQLPEAQTDEKPTQLAETPVNSEAAASENQPQGTSIMEALKIKEHMEVVGSDGEHVGLVNPSKATASSSPATTPTPSASTIIYASKPSRL